MIILLYIFIGILGTIIGSFINVLVSRGHAGESLMGRSHCMSCHKTIPVIYLIPIIGYFLSGCRCFSCHTKISPRYVIGELLLGIVYMVTFSGIMSYGVTLSMLGIIFIVGVYVCVTLLFYVSYYDSMYRLVPVFPLIGVVILATVFQLVTGVGSWIGGLWGICIGLPFVLLWVISHGSSFGFGDIEIIIVMGYVIGMLYGFWYALGAVFGAFWLGTLVIGGYVVYRLIRGDSYMSIRKIHFPFAPFLLVVFWIVIMFRVSIIFSLYTLFMK